MSTQKQKNLEKLIFDSLDKEIEGTDIYNHNGSMWVIFTDDKKWVVEYTKEQTLWYNYTLFNSIMMLFGMDNNETAEYVKTWFENRFLFKPKVEEINHVDVMKFFNNKMDDTIQNGVKNTRKGNPYFQESVEDTIQNGVKRTLPESIPDSFGINDTIQNGVKHTRHISWTTALVVEDTIQNGIKDTKSMCGKRGGRVDYTIQNGVKRVYTSGESKLGVEDTIQNGVKEVKSMKQDRNSRHGIIKIEDEIPIHIYMGQVQDVVQNGVKQ